ncbi:MAG: LPS assembly lipoprotein LptE [Candidatus Berkiellales bacterium]
MRKIFSFVIIIFLLNTLSACGFHLHKSQLDLSNKYPTIILPYSGTHTLHQALRRALISSSINVLDEAPSSNNDPNNVPVLTVISQDLGQQPLVYGADSELRRERLKMVVGFSFGAAKKNQFILSTERDRQLNANQTLGDNDEKIVIEREMQADIINQLLRYIDMEKNALLP